MDTSEQVWFANCHLAVRFIETKSTSITPLPPRPRSSKSPAAEKRLAEPIPFS
jgi:hypothetical protein